MEVSTKRFMTASSISVSTRVLIPTLPSPPNTRSIKANAISVLTSMIMLPFKGGTANILITLGFAKDCTNS